MRRRRRTSTIASVQPSSEPQDPSILPARSSPGTISASAFKTVKIPATPYRRPAPVPVTCKTVARRRLVLKNCPLREVPASLVTGVLLYEGVEEEIRHTLHTDHFPLPFFTPSPPVYNIVPFANSGIGMVAIADIACGETIVCERPLLVYPAAVRGATVRDALNILERGVQGLHPENRSAVHALTNAKVPDWPSHLKGILDTNSVGIGALLGYHAMYAALPRDIARVNHRSAHHRSSGT